MVPHQPQCSLDLHIRIFILFVEGSDLSSIKDILGLDFKVSVFLCLCHTLMMLT